jgi:hypothetical protein
MKTKIEIIGVKPILFHRFNLESLQELAKPKSGSSGNNPDEWRTSFFHDEGRIYIPGSYLVSALKNGAIHTKVGRGTLQKTWMSGVQVEEEKIFVGAQMPEGWEEMETADFPRDPCLPVFLDIRMVANPNTKGRNIRYRVGCGVGWKMNFTLEVDPSLLSKQHVRKVVEDTGKMQGIADGRTLGFGRFKVEAVDFDA